MSKVMLRANTTDTTDTVTTICEKGDKVCHFIFLTKNHNLKLEDLAINQNEKLSIKLQVLRMIPT